MKLISLNTTNFKKLGNASFDFTEGLNVIVGENAHGKSTLLQAIEAALFGITVVPGKKENVPTWGQSTFTLELVFEVNNLKYTLVRSKSTAKLTGQNDTTDPDDVQLLANGNTPVTAYIETLLGLTTKDYNLFVQSKQGETAGILTFGGAALSRKVEEFAGIDVIDKVQVAANDRAKKSAGKAEASFVAPETLKGLGVTVKDAADALAKAGQGLADAKSAAVALQDLELSWPTPSSEELSRQRRSVDKKLREQSQLQADVKSLSEQLDALLAEEVEEPSDVEQVKADLAQLKERTTTINDEIEQLKDQQRTRKALQERVEELEERLVQAAGDTEELLGGEQESTLRESLETATDDMEQVTSSRTELKVRIQQLHQMSDDANCPTCGTKLTDHDPVKLKEELDDLADQLVAANDKLAQLKSGKNALSEKLSALEKLQALSQDLNEHRESTIAKLEPLDPAALLGANIEALVQEAEALAPEAGDLQHLLSVNEQLTTTYKKHQTKLKNLRRQLQNAEQALSDFGEVGTAPTDDEIERAAQVETENRAAEQAHADKKRELQRAVEAAQQAVTACEHSKASADLGLAEAVQKSEQYKTASEETDKSKRLSRFLGDKRSTYLQEVWDTVLHAASRQVSLSTGGLIERISYDDGEFLFVEDGIEAPVTSASGAQKAHIGVAVRIGLARALYGSDSLLIFDEPTESMSEHNAAGLAGSLAGTAKQVLLITHREQDQGLAQNIIEL